MLSTNLPHICLLHYAKYLLNMGFFSFETGFCFVFKCGKCALLVTVAFQLLQLRNLLKEKKYQHHM